jgi:hypothetical protein
VQNSPNLLFIPLSTRLLTLFQAILLIHSSTCDRTFTTNVELPKLDTVMAQLISNLNQVVVIIDTKKSLSNKVV